MHTKLLLSNAYSFRVRNATNLKIARRKITNAICHRVSAILACAHLAKIARVTQIAYWASARMRPVGLQKSALENMNAFTTNVSAR